MATDEGLRLDSVDAGYGDAPVLHQVSLALAPGRLLGLLGRNGAGKTTCLAVAMGQMRPQSGRILLDGTAIEQRPPEDRAALGMALVPQGRRIFKSLTVRDNLRVAARKVAHGGGWTLETVLAAFPRLAARAQHLAGKLSGGEQQMLAIGRALMANPRILLMDEPAEGLAPQIVAELMATIRSLKAQGLSILLVEQNPKLVLAIADDIAVLNCGRLVMTAPAAEVSLDALGRHLGIC